jgi:HSP20 family molecular chaperone IbpA
MLNKYYDSMLKTPTLFDTLRTLEDLYSTPYTTRTRVHTSSSVYRTEEKDNELHLSVDLPGVKSKDLSVQATGRDIKVTGKLRGEEFKYSYVLSRDYDPETVTATHEDGVLTLTFGKTTVAKTRTIEIKTR